MAVVASVSRNRRSSYKTLLLSVCLVLSILLNLSQLQDQKLGSTYHDSCSPSKGIRPLKGREEIPDLLQELGLETGIEVGVKQGAFSEIILSKWTLCTNYKLVDLWAHQKNYKDIANVDDSKHNEFLLEAKERLKKWEDKIEYFKMYSTEAAKKIEKESVDFIYIDARHDYCGAMQDLEHYWPLLKPGGVMAGHDYNENNEVRGQDWGICEDGTRNDRAVKGAVNDFFIPKGLTISVNYRERNFHSWLVQKPLC